jgi:hypothetical protein
MLTITMNMSMETLTMIPTRSIKDSTRRLEELVMSKLTDQKT